MNTGLAVGGRYRVKMIDQTYPVIERDPNVPFGFVDTGLEEAVIGKSMTITVCEFPADRPGFARVFNHEKGREHLVHVPSIERTESIGR